MPGGIAGYNYLKNLSVLLPLLSEYQVLQNGAKSGE
jgi:hypothetical protein